MVYCQSGDKPTVKYKFNNQKERIYRSQFSPIEVIAKNLPLEATSTYLNEGFLINYRSVSCTNFNCAAIVHDWYAETDRFGYGELYYIPCGQTSYPKNADGSRRLIAFLTVGKINDQWAFPNYSIKCPSTNKQRCSIQILHNGLIIFQDQGDCPVTFSVSCGNCPDGQEEHKTSTYPGYCCMDCASLEAEIRTITNTIRRLNRG
ncbi:hypothetical protein [Anabaena azotica]|uniref:Uncharacterized protein n=1 Tax=Anabaena azotica FACHB-119 TaxID=947527 RepID=A0ABR8D866_9NOST|nr:hypothetical protein [Anabaena azotica]MBD2503131.1 hypothetical protein [Anabaena azotica FACHB-119]